MSNGVKLTTLFCTPASLIWQLGREDLRQQDRTALEAPLPMMAAAAARMEESSLARRRTLSSATTRATCWGPGPRCRGQWTGMRTLYEEMAPLGRVRDLTQPNGTYAIKKLSWTFRRPANNNHEGVDSLLALKTLISRKLKPISKIFAQRFKPGFTLFDNFCLL
jgi:hypothetical protein